MAWRIYFANTQYKNFLKIQWGFEPPPLTPLWVRQLRQLDQLSESYKKGDRFVRWEWSTEDVSTVANVT